jgi:exonuclease III
MPIYFDFDVIVLSEVWSTNINFYSNILPGYTFYYDLPVDSTVGGVGIFVKADLVQHEVPQYKLPNSSTNRVENIWLEIVKNNKHYIIGGIYRHPNQNISIFRDSFDPVLNRLSSQKYPCLIAGDINIDLTKCNVNNQTAEYVDMLLLNNFVPTVVMPTRITSHSATLIDHMYYYEGKKPSEFVELESGNFLNDLSDCLTILYC